MIRWTDLALTPPALTPCVATFGNFDGVHRGHQAILAHLVEASRRLAVPGVVVTFDPHPSAIFHPEQGLELITPGPLRDQLLEDTGIDGLLVQPFSREYAQQSPEAFIETTFVDTMRVRALVVGEDARGFGKDYSGDISTLRRLGVKHGFEVIVLKDLGDDARWSSTAVREQLAIGDVTTAARVLGRPHRVVGTVVHGDDRGHELGFPTANLGEDSLGLVPADGVYAGWLTRTGLSEDDADRTLPAAISIGTNPTFEGRRARRVEAHVLDRDDLDLYDEKIMVEFVERIRPTLKFDSIDALLDAMAGDVTRCRQVLSSIVPS